MIIYRLEYDLYQLHNALNKRIIQVKIVDLFILNYIANQ